MRLAANDQKNEEMTSGSMGFVVPLQ